MRPVFATLTLGAMIATLAAAQNVHYSVTDLGTFGGNFSVAYGIDNSGRAIGAAATLNGDTHAFLSGIGKIDLGTMPGGHNSQPGGPAAGLQLSILSDTGTPDPNNEDFCGFGNHMICRAGTWNGSIQPLPNLPGGNNAVAFWLNSRGQVVGVAENGVRDSRCPAPQLFDYQAVTWTSGAIQPLPFLPGDTVSMALQINNRGQVVGISGNCDNSVFTAVGLLLGPRAVLWDNGTAIDLGNLGGSAAKAGAINDRGEIAGLSSLPGDTAIHAYLWTPSDKKMHDIGVLGADTVADPVGINNSTQIVGGSCDAAMNCRAFLWEKGKMTDLNDLADPNSNLYLLYGFSINDAGEIAGFALQKSTGEVHAYVAQPVHANTPQPAAVPSAIRTMSIPDNLRRMMRSRLHNWNVGGSR